MKKLIQKILKETTDERMDRLVMDYLRNTMPVEYPYSSDPGFAVINVGGQPTALLDPRVQYNDPGTKYQAVSLVNNMCIDLIDTFSIEDEDAETYVFRYFDEILGDDYEW
jgi:hypothetical protein